MSDNDVFLNRLWALPIVSGHRPHLQQKLNRRGAFSTSSSRITAKAFCARFGQVAAFL